MSCRCDEPEIESGIPIPPSRIGKNSTHTKAKTYVLKMKDGDSMVVQKHVANLMLDWGKTLGIELVTRAAGSKRRVWRVRSVSERKEKADELRDRVNQEVVERFGPKGD